MVRFVGNGIALVDGLPRVKSEEIIQFPGNLPGVAFNVDAQEVGVILLGETGDLKAGVEVRRTGRVLDDVPVGEALLWGGSWTVWAVPWDDLGPVQAAARLPVEREAPAIMDRDPVTVPLQTGLKVIDALIPIGRGQRELILGDRQTGKTTPSPWIPSSTKRIRTSSASTAPSASGVRRWPKSLPICSRHGAMNAAPWWWREGERPARDCSTWPPTRPRPWRNFSWNRAGMS